jgi:pantothenate synthetase
VAAVNPETFEPAEFGADRILIATAAHIGSTRLIDNTLLDAG